MNPLWSALKDAVLYLSAKALGGPSFLANAVRAATLSVVQVLAEMLDLGIAEDIQEIKTHYIRRSGAKADAEEAKARKLLAEAVEAENRAALLRRNDRISKAEAEERRAAAAKTTAEADAIRMKAGDERTRAIADAKATLIDAVARLREKGGIFAVEAAELAAEGVSGQQSSADDDVQQLLNRVRSGDREAAAAFVRRFEPIIRRRIQGKLGPAMRRLFDSQEILSTLGRRLEHVVRSGSVRAESVKQLLTYVFTIADHALIEKARMFSALEKREGEDESVARSMAIRLHEAERREADAPLIEIDAALRSLDNEEDRQILSLWLMGQRLIDIAADVGLDYDVVRKRWENIRGRLRKLFESGGI